MLDTTQPSGATAVIAGAIQINEIRPNPEGDDPSTQQVELRGTAGETFSGFLYSLESDAGASANTVDRKSAIGGTFDANGLLTVSIPDLENPSITLVLTDDTATANVGDVIDTASPSDLGVILDAIGVTDTPGDPIVGAALGGTDIAFSGDEPELIFRDGTTGELHAVNDPDGGEIYDADGDTFAPSDFDIDPLAGDTFGALNPSRLGTPEPALVINEVLGSTTGVDVEYIELFGTPGASLSGLSLIVVESDAGATNGAIDARFDFDAGAVLGDNGFHLVGNDLVAGTYSVTPDAIIAQNFVENSSYTLALAETASLAGATVSGAEVVLDAIGVTDGGASDSFAFGAPVLGPDGSFLPAGVGRIMDGGDTDTASDFAILDFSNDPSVNTPTNATADTGGGDGDVVAIYDIQGAAHASPLLGQSVLTSGMVTAVDTNGFYLQDLEGDGDIATSDAVFVFTGGAPDIAVGDEVEVDGTVSEFFPGGAGTGNLSTTQIAGSPTVTVIGSGNALPAPEVIGQGGRILPDVSIDDDSFSAFEPLLDGIDFFEALEGMLVTARDLVAISGTNRFGEIFAVADRGADASGLSLRGTLNISPDDFNPERIQIDEDTGILPGFDLPQVNTSDLLGDVTGVMSFDFGNFQIQPTQAFTPTPSGLTPEVTGVVGDDDTLTVASYNVLNLDAVVEDPANILPGVTGGVDDDIGDGRFDAIAAQIVGSLNSPDIIGLQEIQDNTGAEGIDNVTSASTTLQALIEAIEAAGGPSYSFIDNTFIGDELSGGIPGGNIRTAFLYNAARVDLDPGSVETIGGQGAGEAFEGGRLPLVADFTFNGERVSVINNHFSSKGGSAPILGTSQPFEALQEDTGVNGSLDERQAQSAAIQAFIAARLADDADAKIVTLGDFNEFEFVSPLTGLEATLDRNGTGANNLTNTLTEDERYSFNFQGNSQSLDHILVSDALEAGAEFDIVHVNSEFAETPSRASDHDPLVAGLTIPAASSTFTLELLHITDQEASTGQIGDFARASGILNALEAQDIGDDGLSDNTVRLSSGDAIIPGLFYDAAEDLFGTGGIADIQLVNEMGFDAVALGNHEFDGGTRALSELITGQDVTDDSDLGDPDDPTDDKIDKGPRSIGTFDALSSGTALDGQDYTGTAFPYLSTNLDFSTDAFLAPLEVPAGQTPLGSSVTSSVVLDVNGEPLGVVGAVTPNLGEISNIGGVGISPTWASGTPTEDERDALSAEIQLEVDALLAANPGLNKVVLLTHMQQIGIEYDLAPRLSNVDIIVGGGSNTRLFDGDDYMRPGDSDQGEYPQFFTDLDGNPIAVVNTDGSYKYVGRLVIDFDAEGRIVRESYDASVSGAYATDAQGLANVDGAEGLIDPEVQAITDAVERVIFDSESDVFGISDVFLNGNRSGAADDPADLDGVRTQETNLGNLTADANLAAARAVDSNVLVSLKNGGGIRAPIGETVVPPGGNAFVRQPNGEIRDDQGNVVKPTGGISRNDIATTLSFNNQLTLLTLSHLELLAVLEHGVGEIGQGRFPQIAGVNFSFDATQPVGSRIINAAISDDDGTDLAVIARGGAVQDASAIVRIVTLNFLAGGGDGYPFPTGPGADRVDLTDADGNGVDDDAFTGVATFSADGTEQDALAEYLAANFGGAANAFGDTDVGRVEDTRIQNLAFREDTVLDDAVMTDIPLHLIGTRADDVLVGGAANDTILVRLGEDTATGNGGADTFIVDARYVGAGDQHTITDLAFAEGDAIRFNFFGTNRMVRSDADLEFYTMGGFVTVLDTAADGSKAVSLQNLEDGFGTSGLRLIGTRRDDTLDGDAGDDTILLRLGNDTAVGDAGADTFQFDGRYVNDGDAHTVTDLSFADGDAVSLRFWTAGVGRVEIGSQSELDAIDAESWASLDATGAAQLLTLTNDQGDSMTVSFA